MRFTFRNIAVTGVSATTLTFSREPGAQANAAAKVCPCPSSETIVLFPQTSSCITKTLPLRITPIASVVSPARSTNASLG